jgi:hypothetical protein
MAYKTIGYKVELAQPKIIMTKAHKKIRTVEKQYKRKSNYQKEH